MRSINYRIIIATTFLLVVGLVLWMNQKSELAPQFSNTEVSGESVPLIESRAEVREAAYTIPRTIRYRFLATNRTGEMLEKVKLTMFSPLAATSTQKNIKLDANERFEIVEDALGNRIMEFVIDRVPPYATKVFNIEAQLMMAEKPQPLVNGSNDIYLQNGPLYDLDNEEIIKLAGNLRLQNDADSARAIYDWVKNNLDYSGYIASDRGASYAMRTRQGDCTEYAYLLAALARINNIPARIMAGFVYANNAILRPYDYHNWVELYVDDRWQIVDPLNDVFFEQKASHVALRIIGGEGRLNYLASQKGIESDPRLEVKMQ